MLKSLLPQTLMSRSLLILVLPVILAQIIAVSVFWDNHWDKITRRLALSVAGEVSVMVDRLEQDGTQESYNFLNHYMTRNLGLKTEFTPHIEASQIVKARPHYGFWEHFIIAPLLKQLEEKIPNKFNVIYNSPDKQAIIQIQLSQGLLRIFVPESRLYSSSGYVFILLLVSSSLILLIISIIFLRNQIRPIRRLAAAASLMGKGRTATIGKIRGAKEVRQASEAFETMQRRIRRQIEQRTDMLAGVSHDLRTPLTRLRLNLSLLDNQKDAADMLKDLDEMEKMMDAYLEFARGEKAEDAEHTNISEMLDDLAGLYRKQVKNLSLNITGHQQDVIIQRINFRRALENILSNAVRYADEIHILVEFEESRLRITIEDNGPGIDEQEYEQAFKPFVCLDASRNKQTGGVGLGLSVAMDIILSHGGKINLGRSETLRGLKVMIRIPL